MKPPRARSRILRLLLAAVAVLTLSAGSALAAERHVVVLTATGVVDSVMAGYLVDGIAAAERDGAAAVVIKLDTPGGSLDATAEIYKALLGAKIPTIVWVAPAGARAASAGTFITLAAHLAYMAPGTHIGAASPVDSSGNDITGTLGEKVRQDAIAAITSIAQERGRNVEWAVSTVADARSSAVEEAVSLHAVDGVAASLDEVLQLATGRELTIGGQTFTLDLSGATVQNDDMNPFQGLLHLLSDPNIAFILFTIGFYGLIAELWHPNFVTGILGALSIILALIGFGSLPLNVGGLLLVGLGLTLFALEPSVPSHGLLTLGGVVSFVLGASALYTTPGDATGPIVSVALPLLVTMTATTVGFAALITFAAVRSRRLHATAGTVGVPIAVGTAGIVKQPLDPVGSVHAAGEEWTARTEEGAHVERGAAVRVVRIDGLTLVVEPDPSSAGSA